MSRKSQFGPDELKPAAAGTLWIKVTLVVLGVVLAGALAWLTFFASRDEADSHVAGACAKLIDARTSRPAVNQPVPDPIRPREINSGQASAATEPVLLEVCQRISAQERSNKDDVGPLSLLIAMALSALLGAVLSRLVSPGNSDLRLLPTQFDDANDRHDKRFADAEKARFALEQRVRSLESGALSSAGDASDLRDPSPRPGLRGRAGAKGFDPPSPEVVARRDERARIDRVGASEAGLRSTAAVPLSPAPHISPPPALETNELIETYRELIANQGVTPSEFDAALSRFGQIESVVLRDGQLALSPSGGGSDVEKRLVAVVISAGRTAILFPSRTYSKNFAMTFNDRARAGPDVALAFELVADRGPSLAYVDLSQADIQPDGSLRIATKGRLGGYTA